MSLAIAIWNPHSFTLVNYNMNLMRESDRLEHVVSTNIVYYNKVNEVFYNELKFDSISSLENNPVN